MAYFALPRREQLNCQHHMSRLRQEQCWVARTTLRILPFQRSAISRALSVAACSASLVRSARLSVDCFTRSPACAPCSATF